MCQDIPGSFCLGVEPGNEASCVFAAVSLHIICICMY